MVKRKLGSNPFLFPMPAAIVGAEVEGKPCYMTIAYCGIVNNGPAMLAIGSNPSHYTVKGIEEHGCFSVNIPSTDIVMETDYVGMVSGASTDKSDVFTPFYGSLKHAPLIEECPVGLECKLVKRLDIGGNDSIFIGEIVETYCNESCLEDGVPDIKKVDPVIYGTGTREYWGLGKKLAKAWSVGSGYVKRS